MSSSAPATPVTIPTVPATGTPRTWRHPRLDEIEARLSATTFDEKNVKKILWNAVYLLSTFVIPFIISQVIPQFRSQSDSGLSYETYILNAFRVLLIGQIIQAFSPLYKSKDDLSDIPLTPTQRALFGLPPASKPATPGSQYITPPKYAKSTTPRSSGRSPSGSPYSGSQSGRGGSPYSPSASPLFQKPVGSDAVRRLSYGTPSPLGASQVRGLNESTTSLTPSSPTPAGGRGPGVNLSSKWVYERTKSSPSLLRSLYM